MDPISQARLDSLRSTDTNTWSDDDKAFVRARSPYLTSDELVKFADALKAEQTPAAPEGEISAEVPPEKSESQQVVPSNSSSR
jgi:hypothetical protein